MAKGSGGGISVRRTRPVKIYEETWDKIVDIRTNAQKARKPVPSFADAIEAAFEKYKPKLYKLPEKNS